MTSELKLHPTKIFFFHIFETTAQISVMLVGTCFHGYVLHFVRKNSKNPGQNKRYRIRYYTKTLTRTIVYIYLCLVFFTLPHILYSFLIFSSKPKNYLSLKTIRFGDILLNDLNSYANALIYLPNMRRKPGRNKTNPQPVSRLKIDDSYFKVLIITCKHCVSTVITRLCFLGIFDSYIACVVKQTYIIHHYYGWS